MTESFTNLSEPTNASELFLLIFEIPQNSFFELKGISPNKKVIEELKKKLESI